MIITVTIIALIYLAIIFILVFLSMYLVHRWTSNRIIRKQKTKASDPVDGTNWFTYDSTGAAKRVQDKGRELRRELYEKGGKINESR